MANTTNIEYGSGKTEDAAGKKPMYRHEKGHCPPGHYWNGKKCVQKIVGP